MPKNTGGFQTAWPGSGDTWGGGGVAGPGSPEEGTLTLFPGGVDT